MAGSPELPDYLGGTPLLVHAVNESLLLLQHMRHRPAIKSSTFKLGKEADKVHRILQEALDRFMVEKRGE